MQETYWIERQTPPPAPAPACYACGCTMHPEERSCCLCGCAA